MSTKPCLLAGGQSSTGRSSGGGLAAAHHQEPAHGELSHSHSLLREGSLPQGMHLASQSRRLAVNRCTAPGSGPLAATSIAWLWAGPALSRFAPRLETSRAQVASELSGRCRVARGVQLPRLAVTRPNAIPSPRTSLWTCLDTSRPLAATRAARHPPAPESVRQVQVSQAGHVVAPPQRDQAQRHASRQRVALPVAAGAAQLRLPWRCLHGACLWDPRRAAQTPSSSRRESCLAAGSHTPEKVCSTSETPPPPSRLLPPLPSCARLAALELLGVWWPESARWGTARHPGPTWTLPCHDKCVAMRGT